MNIQTFCELVEDDNSSAQSMEFLLARQSKCKLWQWVLSTLLNVSCYFLSILGFDFVCFRKDHCANRNRRRNVVCFISWNFKVDFKLILFANSFKQRWSVFSFCITVAASQVVWMGGVVNSTRSNRFANGLNMTHVAALFYSSTAFAIENHGWVLQQ